MSRTQSTRRPSDDSGRPVSGVRFPYLLPGGQHGFRVPAPFKAFDIDSYMINMMGLTNPPAQQAALA